MALEGFGWISCGRSFYCAGVFGIRHLLGIWSFIFHIVQLSYRLSYFTDELGSSSPNGFSPKFFFHLLCLGWLLFFPTCYFFHKPFQPSC